jgi:hypothetical protein
MKRFMLAVIAEVADNEFVFLGSRNTVCITTLKFNSKTKRDGLAVKSRRSYDRYSRTSQTNAEQLFPNGSDCWGGGRGPRTY